MHNARVFMRTPTGADAPLPGDMIIIQEQIEIYDGNMNLIRLSPRYQPTPLAPQAKEPIESEFIPPNIPREKPITTTPAPLVNQPKNKKR